MNAVAVIAKREYVERLKSRGFIIGTILGLVGIVGLSFIPLLFGLLGRSFATRLVVIAPNVAVASAIKSALAGGDYKLSVARERSAGAHLPDPVKADLKAGKFDAALVAYKDASGLAFAFYPKKSNALDDAPALQRRLLRAVIVTDIKGVDPSLADRALHFGFKVVNLNERYKNEVEESFGRALVYFLVVLLYMAVLFYGLYVAHGVIEEKSNRVMELMIGAVRPSQLLSGKIAGIGSLALSQILLFVVAAAAMFAIAGLGFANQSGPGGLAAARAAADSNAIAAGAGIVTVPASTLVYLVVFFLLGFFSYATLFAGVGALASKAEDIQQSNSIVVWPLLLAYFLAIFALSDPDKPLIVAASLMPLLSPMIMFTRVATAIVPPWQIAASIGLSLASIWLFTLLAAKLYRVGVLMYGKPPTPREIWRALRSPG